MAGRSFRAKAADRVHECGFEGLVAHGCERDQQDAGAGAGEDPPGQGCSIVFIVLEPLAHSIIGHGDGDEHGDGGELEKIF